MKVSEFFQNLSYGPFSNMSIGMDGVGTIDASKHGKVIYLTNRALTQLYSRFILSVGTVTIEMIEGQKTYLLDKLYAVTDTTPGNTKPRYIKDTGNPFTGGMLRLLALDDQSELGASARLVGTNIVQVDEPQAGELLVVEYQKTHPTLILTGSYLDQEIVIHPLLEEALECKVAADIFGQMGGETGVMESSRLSAKYEEVLAMIKGEGMISDTYLSDAFPSRDVGMR